MFSVHKLCYLLKSRFSLILCWKNVFLGRRKALICKGFPLKFILYFMSCHGAFYFISEKIGAFSKCQCFYIYICISSLNFHIQNFSIAFVGILEFRYRFTLEWSYDWGWWPVWVWVDGCRGPSVYIIHWRLYR